MKSQIYFIIALLSISDIAFAQKEKDPQPRILFMTYDYRPLKTFKGDTIEYFYANFGNTMRYEGKSFKFLFKEIEQDLPIKTIWFGKSMWDDLSALYLFFEPKETIIQKIKQNKEISCIQVNIEGFPNKEKNPDIYNQIATWGLDKLLDMTQEIRHFLKNKNAKNIVYNVPQTESVKKTFGIQ